MHKESETKTLIIVIYPVSVTYFKSDKGMRYFHGSENALPLGLELRGRGFEYEQQWQTTDFYAILEKYRPTACLSHKNAVFMCDNIEDIDNAGGIVDFIYQVEPLSEVSCHDVNWCSQISCLLSEGLSFDDDQIVSAAISYWNGTAFDVLPVWEYLSSHVRVIKEID